MYKTGAEKRKTALIILSAVAFFLAGVMIFGLVFSFGNIKNGNTQIKKNPNFTMNAYGNETMSLAMVSQSNSLAEGYVITATVTPSEAANKEIEWSLEFVEKNSTWAQGKNVNTYIGLQPVTEDGLQVHVSCLQAFGERIKVIAKSKENPNVSAYAVCEYYERVSNVSGNVTGIGNFNTANEICEWTYTTRGGISGLSGDYSLTEITASIFTENSVCTINDTFHDAEITVTPTKEFERAMRAKYSSYECESVTFTVNNGSVLTNLPKNYGSGCFFPLSGMISLTDGIGSDAVERMIVENYVCDILRENPNMCFMKVDITMAGEHNTVTKTFQLKAKQSSLPVKVANVSLDKSTLTF